MNKLNLLIIGAGGHAKVVYSSLLTVSEDVVVQFIDNYKTGELFSCPILSWDDDIILNHQSYHVAIGDNATRKKIIENFGQNHLFTIRHKKAIASDFSLIAPGSFLAASSVVSADASVGTGSIINHNAVIDHDCVIGDYCHIAPSATLGGNVKLGQGVFVGSNATIMPGVQIGEWSTVGAGAVVTKSISQNKVVKGVPAR